MLKEVKRYELVENITKEDLLKAGFKEGGWDSYILNPKVSYSCVLYEDIELHIEISTSSKRIRFNDYNNVLVFDDEIGQPYFPFYKGIETEYIHKVIEKYNQKMDEFKEKGILKEKEQVKQKVKKR